MNKCLNIEESIQIAKNFKTKLKLGDIILLNGDLGTGKTFFVQNIIEDIVTSPTFTIMKDYDEFRHIDAYRLEDSNEDTDFLFEDCENKITFIEWSKYLKNIPYVTYIIELTYCNEGRSISIKEVK